MKAAQKLETLFQALADRTRLRLLNLIAESEVCVCFFVEVLGEPQPKISRHLAVLRSAGLVAARRDHLALARACCSTRVPDLLKRAPKPAGRSTAGA